jgi:glycine/D-amino acid oxidase-like deaminating enzyme/nitrite reductase/ring-hydroxylating ferredoxin subunit
MPRTTSSTTSVWIDEQTAPVFKSLEGNASCDVAVIGSGIAGLTTAYLLTREGRSVIVLEAGTEIASGETRRTTAHLSNALDDRYFELEKVHGDKTTQLAAQSHTAAIDRIEAIVNEEHIDCGFTRVNGYLFTPPKVSNRILSRELAAAHRAGLSNVMLMDHMPATGLSAGPCLLFPMQGQFHPMKYLAGLCTAILQAGGQIYTSTRAQDVEGGENPVIRTERGHSVTASAVVVATNSPFIEIVTIHTKQHAYRTYAIGASISPDALPDALYWDTGHPYHYVRAYKDLVIIGGEDHKTGQEDKPAMRFRRLERWARKRLPVGEVKYRWSGQVMETLDGLAFIGKDPGGLENVYVATGDSGMGMTHGTIAGILLTDLISGRSNPWAQIYDPARVPVRTLRRYLKENLNMAAQYTGWVTPGAESNVDAIAPGSGAVIRDGLRKVAVHRDEGGALHAVSAVCTHLGCIVNWNGAEKTWDCPCHGSRFDKSGRVLNGPAVTDLEPMEIDRRAA